MTEIFECTPSSSAQCRKYEGNVHIMLNLKLLEWGGISIRISGPWILAAESTVSEHL